MFNKKWLAVAVFSVAALGGNAQAKSIPDKPAAETKSAVEVKEGVNDAIKEKIQAGFYRVSKSLKIANVSSTPVPGVYLVEGGNGELLYASADGGFIFAGDLLQIKEGGLENLTNKVRGQKAIKALSAIDKKDMVVYPAQGETKRVMYVFTDVDCGYCRKLHGEVPELNKNGVEVRYLAFPRGGSEASAYKKMVSAWCAKDPKEALGKLKSGETLPVAECDNAILDQYNLGTSLGVSGTPAIYLDDGQMVPGYRPADALLKVMGINKG